jgi:hypothetical protein
MNQTRYIYRTVPLSEERAKEIRTEEIESELSEIEYRKQQIRECEEHILRLKGTPLATTREEQISLNPGDPGYNEAPPIFSPTQYQGDIKWINQ